MPKPKIPEDAPKLVKVALNLEINTKEWFQKTARLNGMQMSQFMSYVLSDFYKRERNGEAIRALASLTSNEELQEANQNLVEVLSKLAQTDEAPPPNSLS